MARRVLPVDEARVHPRRVLAERFELRAFAALLLHLQPEDRVARRERERGAARRVDARHDLRAAVDREGARLLDETERSAPAQPHRAGVQDAAPVRHDREDRAPRVAGHHETRVLEHRLRVAAQIESHLEPRGRRARAGLDDQRCLDGLADEPGLRQLEARIQQAGGVREDGVRRDDEQHREAAVERRTATSAGCSTTISHGSGNSAAKVMTALRVGCISGARWSGRSSAADCGRVRPSIPRWCSSTAVAERRQRKLFHVVGDHEVAPGAARRSARDAEASVVGARGEAPALQARVIARRAHESRRCTRRSRSVSVTRSTESRDLATAYRDRRRATRPKSG